MEIVLRQDFPGSMEELSAPQISLAPGVQVGLVGANQLLAVFHGVGLNLQGVFGHQQPQWHGGGRRDPVDKFGFHFGFWRKKKKKPERKDTELSGSWATGQWVLWFVTQEDLFRLFDDKCLFSRQINEGQSCSLCLFCIIRW